MGSLGVTAVPVMRTPRPTLLVTALSVAALRCAPDSAGPVDTRLTVRGAIRYTDDVGGFAYRVQAADCATGAAQTDAPPLVATVRADALYLPSGASATGASQGPVHGDHTFVIEPGCYDITSQPLRSDTDEPSAYCLPAHASAVRVDDGLTTEVYLISQCPGPARSVDDVSSVTNGAPALAMLVDPPAGHSVCEALRVCADASDPDGDPIEFAWTLLSGAPAIPLTALDTIRNQDGSLTQCVVTQCGQFGDLSLRVDAYDLARDHDGAPRRIDDLVRAEGAAGSRASSERTLTSSVPCSVTGRSLTILLTLHGPDGRTMPPADARRLAGNAARWVGDADAPRVLVVRDQNHRGEDLEDVDRLVDDLAAELGPANVARLDEESLPTPGDLQPADVAGYDVVWFANPGAPIDSLTTFNTLLGFRAGGGGVVLQGDDIAHLQSPEALADTLTFVHYENGGARACGRDVDGWQAGAYDVSFEPGAHPVLAGLTGGFAYANDIDLVAPAGLGEAVVMTARLVDGDCSVATPAIVAVDPTSLVGSIP